MINSCGQQNIFAGFFLFFDWYSSSAYFLKIISALNRFISIKLAKINKK